LIPILRYYFKNGLNRIYLNGNESFIVNCENDGSTRIMLKIHDTTIFNTSYYNYINGFGNLSNVNSYWMGLDKIRLLLKILNSTLRIEFSNSFNETNEFVEFSYFTIKDSTHKYVLELATGSIHSIYFIAIEFIA
jgi:hypothetical protein